MRESKYLDDSHITGSANRASVTVTFNSDFVTHRDCVHV